MPERSPFHPELPARLTYATGVNQRPSFSEDGRSLLYAHADPDEMVGDTDHDICLGVLPASGGQRTATVCLPSANDGFRRDGIEHGALSADGTLAFVYQTGIAGNGTVLESKLYVAAVDSLAGRRAVFELKRQPAGALDRWDVLLNPTWHGDGHLVALAARMDLVVPFPNAPPDTIYTGVEVVRFNAEGPEATWERIGAAPGATAMTWDRIGSRALYHRDNRVFDAATGTLLYTLDVPLGAVAGEISGIAAAGGELYTSERFLYPLGDTDVRAVTRIVRVAADGAAAILLSKDTSGPSRVTWTRLTVSPDGGRVAYEEVGNGLWAIYLAELPQ